MSKAPLQEAEILIEALLKTGEGVGFFQKNQVKIAHAYPGDLVLAEIGKNKKRGFLKGRLKTLLKPALERSAPVCPHANLCGGCKLGQLNYEAQLKYKEKLLHRTFCGFPQAVFSSIVPSKNWEYRNKMEFTFSENRAGSKFLGLMIASAGKYVFNVEKCFLAPPWMSQLLNAVRAFWLASLLKAFNPLVGAGILRYLTLRETIRTKQKMAVLTIQENALEKFSLANQEALVQAARSAVPEGLSLLLRKQISQKGSATHFSETVLFGQAFMEEELFIKNQRLKFKISSSSFFQPNPLQAEKLYALALDLAEVRMDMCVFDLYAGTGSLGMVFAPFVKEVVCIEENPAAVLDAKENFRLNGLKNIEIYQGEVGALLAQNFSLKKPDLVVLDPPRAGLSALAIKHLLLLAPSRILYISCNIETQQRDLLALASQGYLLKALQPVDQFPQTMHLENIALLQRSPAVS
jgi:23S rRNA (uracil1939-C5)-methyltransferase